MARRRRDFFYYFCGSLSISLWKMKQNWENSDLMSKKFTFWHLKKVNFLPFWNPKGKKVYPKRYKKTLNHTPFSVDYESILKQCTVIFITVLFGKIIN